MSHEHTEQTPELWWSGTLGLLKRDNGMWWVATGGWESLRHHLGTGPDSNPEPREPARLGLIPDRPAPSEDVIARARRVIGRRIGAPALAVVADLAADGLLALEDLRDDLALLRTRYDTATSLIDSLRGELIGLRRTVATALGVDTHLPTEELIERLQARPVPSPGTTSVGASETTSNDEAGSVGEPPSENSTVPGMAWKNVRVGVSSAVSTDTGRNVSDAFSDTTDVNSEPGGQPKPGDRVRVTFRGADSGRFYEDTVDAAGLYVHHGRVEAGIATVEVVERAPEQPDHWQQCGDPDCACHDADDPTGDWWADDVAAADRPEQPGGEQ